MKIEGSAEEWELVRNLLSRGCAHLGAEVANTGLPAAAAASQHFAAAVVIEERIRAASLPVLKAVEALAEDKAA